MTKIVLVNGKKRSGKDFFAGVLSEKLAELGYSSEIMAFAGPLKSIVADTFQISEEDLDECKNNPDQYPIGFDLPSNNLRVESNFRKVLQNMGTEAMKRWFGEDVWVNLLLERAEDSGVDFVIVPDFRFLSECISDLTIGVVNRDIISLDTHRSETELDGHEFKWLVDNTGFPDLSGFALGIAKSLVSRGRDL